MTPGSRNCASKNSGLLYQPLVYPHLVGIPCLGSLTARRFARCHLELLGWQTDRAFDAQVLGLGSVDQLLAHLLQRLHLAARQGDADLVNLLRESGVLAL